MADAVVIGSGPNGLVAANLLADAGWDVVVLEANAKPGGAVRSEELLEQGYTNDVFSAFYPLAAASPAIRRLELERWGLRWRHGPLALAHPAADGTCPILSRDLDETAASLDRYAPGDGDEWRELHALWRRIRGPVLQAMTTPFPPVRAGLRLARELRGETMGTARLALLPVRRLALEHFRSPEAARLLAGSGLHADLLPESSGGAVFALVLTALGQDVGWPVPDGGAGSLTDALVRRLSAVGGELRCGSPVERVLVRGGRAVAVRLAGGEEIAARRAVLGAIHVLPLLRDLVGLEHLSFASRAYLERFEPDLATVKVDWTLDGPIPWAADDARRSPCIHVADSIDELSVTAGELARGLPPTNPFLVLGQVSMVDATRCPPGKEVAWAYTHLPFGAPVPDDTVDRIEERVEALAPGFRRLIRKRHVLLPADLEARNASLVGGTLGGGTAQLHQTAVFRPFPGLGRPELPVRGLYLASSSAHPGGGVHGAPGANAARAALRARWRRRGG
jgi:phytoene dehydrogenase-like protein